MNSPTSPCTLVQAFRLHIPCTRGAQHRLAVLPAAALGLLLAVSGGAAWADRAPPEAFFAEPISGKRVTKYEIELPTDRAEKRSFAIPQDCAEVMRCVDQGAVYRATIIDRRLWQKVDSDCRFYSFLYRHPQQIVEDHVSSYDFRNARLSDLPIDRRCAHDGSAEDQQDCNPAATDPFGMLRFFPLTEPPASVVEGHDTGSCAFRDGVFRGRLYVDADGVHCDAAPGAPTLRLIGVDFADINGDHFLDAVLRFVPIGPGAARAPLILPLTRTGPDGPFHVPEPVPATLPVER